MLRYFCFKKVSVQNFTIFLQLFTQNKIYYICGKIRTMSVGTTIRRLRESQGKTQKEIADLLNVDRRTYAKWEEEAAEVKSSLVPNLAEIFGVEIADLYKNDKNIEIKDSFKDNNNNNTNTVVIILTDKELTEKFLDLFNNSLKNSSKE
ncbi:Transcriptional regulator, contains XRE-family HTH domain [Chryseobacterium taihuense]|uniref:Transcriptional regulator, contains XRE-family HTH domain n=2 Tax=Chryseobacterium taihuense TaxID=1141221 RepID=A0ABY0QT62_9FLAO|nr:Transcriptional regulator, contains XRE-family HTH domain [Chryseobacterium taihuense]